MMDGKSFLNKTNLKKDAVLKQLAAYFLSLDPGNNIESVRSLAASLRVSIGMISEMIARIEENGAIKIDHRGKLGSFLVSQSTSLLWKTAITGPLVIAHTLPSNRRYEGLAAALKQIFQEADIEIYFSFMRGSRTRLTALRNGICRIVIMSQFAAQAMIERSEEIALTLPNRSFVKSHRLFVRKDQPANSDTLIAAIDPDSYDQTQISYLEFENQPVKFRNVNFMNIHRHLVKNEVNLAVWTEEDMQEKLDGCITMRTLSKNTEEKLSGRNTKAALVVRADDIATQQLIKKLLKTELISTLQHSVLTGKKIPEY